MAINDEKTILKGDALIEPDDSIEVQMVSGFIQHQQCGLHEQCPRRQGQVSRM